VGRNARRLAGTAPLVVAGLVVVLVLVSASCLPATRPDSYGSYAELSAHEREGIDYEVTVTDRSAPVAVFAIHGGAIDFGTHLIAESVAGADWSLYVFKGKKPKGNWSLHLTSAHFDEPRALALAAKSARCVSIHGHQNEVPRICIGGVDRALRARVTRTLAESGLPFKTIELCPGFEGTAVTNVANQCRDGVQLEFSSRLREMLFSDRALLDRTVKVIRGAVDPAAF
jgi:phage replication-related protein YjqB (UPF0714/DUF867 family)